MLRRSISFLPLFKAEFLLGYQRLAYGLINAFKSGSDCHRTCAVKRQKNDRLLKHPYVCYSDLLLENCFYVYNPAEAIIIFPPYRKCVLNIPLFLSAMTIFTSLQGIYQCTLV